MKLTLSELRRLAREKNCPLIENGVKLAVAPKTKKAKVKRPRLPQEPVRKSPPVFVPWALVISVPIKIVSTANHREHWSAKHRRNKQHAEAVRIAFLASRQIPYSGTGLKITLTRIGGKLIDKADNLPNGFKSVIDEVARQVGTDDGSDYYSWVFDQCPGRETPAVEIRIEPRCIDNSRIGS